MTSHPLVGRINLPPAGHYIVAVSGGVDSVALLHVLAHHYHGKYRLRVAHFNHGIRTDSHRDQNLVRVLSQVYGLPFHTADGRLGAASEDAARQARYSFLNQLLEEYGAEAVITAHHLDDRQETSIFNVVRGAGPVGAGALRSEGRLLRPLLDVRKEDLREYARHYGLPWREDVTNRSVDLSRNFIRHEVLPLARRSAGFDREFSGALTKLDYLNRAVTDGFDSMLEKSKDSIRVPMDAARLLQSHTLTQLVLHMARALDPAAQINRATLEKAAHLIKRGGAGLESSLTGSLMLRLGVQHVQVNSIREDVQALVAQDLIKNGSIRFGRHQVTYGTDHPVQKEHHHVAGSELKVRTVRAGDFIAPVGMEGTKKLQDIFVDAKIERSDRVLWPVVTRTIDDQVVWVPRLAVSRHFLVPADHPQAYCLIHEVIEL